MLNFGVGGEWSKNTVHEKFNVSNILWIPWNRWDFFFGGGYSSVSLELMLGFALSNTEIWEGKRCESLHLWRVTLLGTVAYPKKAFLSRCFSWLSRERWDMWSLRVEGKHSASVSTIYLISLDQTAGLPGVHPKAVEWIFRDRDLLHR